MNLYTTDKFHKPLKYIEGYDSLIWTERYRPCGDFELKTPKIDQTMALMPLGDKVFIEGSSELMTIETQYIEKNDKGEATLTVQGRTLEAFLENRVACSNKEGDGKPWALSSRTSVQAIMDTLKTWVLSPAPNTQDRISNLVITSSVTKTMTSYKRDIELGDFYSRILELLAEDDNGIKVIRPAIGGAGTTTLNLYQGTDRTSSVILSTSAGHFQTEKYLFSIKDWKTAVYVRGQNFLTESMSLPYAQYDRRVALLDASDIVLDFVGDDLEQAKARATAYLGEHQKTKMFSGFADPNIPYKINSDYFLGDIVLCVADYGISTPMRISEYTRVEDDNGERGYPTLSTLGDESI